MSVKKTLNSPKDTAKIAKLIADIFADLGPTIKGATVIGFVGDLGAGKTTFIKAFLRNLGVKGRVQSPTFVIMKSFSLPLAGQAKRKQKGKNAFKHAYHIDAYRIDSKSLPQLGFKEILDDPQNIILIEWAEKIKKSLPKETFWIEMGHGSHHKERIFSLKLNK